MYAENLKKVRMSLGLSVNELADNIKIPARTIGGYERNERAVSLELVAQLSKIYNVNANWFVTGEGEMFNAPQFEQVKDDLAQRMEKMEAALRNAGILAD